jgi:hypothetical protein
VTLHHRRDTDGTARQSHFGLALIPSAYLHNQYFIGKYGKGKEEGDRQATRRLGRRNIPCSVIRFCHYHTYHIGATWEACLSYHSSAPMFESFHLWVMDGLREVGGGRVELRVAYMHEK